MLGSGSGEGTIRIESNDADESLMSVFVDAKNGTGVDEKFAKSPEEFRLYPNHPNPFNAGTLIRYFCPEPLRIDVMVYDARGRLICSLFRGESPQGMNQVRWNGLDQTGVAVPSGLYVVQCRSHLFTRTIKVMCMK
jgi:hypothetical protein